MKRYVRAAAVAAVAIGGTGSVGCVSTGTTTGPGTGAVGDGAILRTYYDPCYPERYNATARDEVLAAFNPQVYNGHILNQTIWNWYFELGTDKLTPAGVAKLESLAQTRPNPDPRLYLQVARDVQVVNANVESVSADREKLTSRRAAVIQKYMASQPAVTPVAYEIYVHDPVVVGIPSDFPVQAFRGQKIGYQGSIRGAGGFGGIPPVGGGGGGGATTGSGSGSGGGGASGSGGYAPSGSSSGGAPSGGSGTGAPSSGTGQPSTGM